MTKMVTVYFGFLLLAMHFLSQVHGQNASTVSPVPTANGTVGGSSIMTTLSVLSVSNSTPKGDSTSLQSSVFSLLIPVVVVGSLLQGRF